MININELRDTESHIKEWMNTYESKIDENIQRYNNHGMHGVWQHGWDARCQPHVGPAMGHVEAERQEAIARLMEKYRAGGYTVTKLVCSYSPEVGPQWYIDW